MKNILMLLIFLLLLSCGLRENGYSRLSTINDDRLRAIVKKYVDDERIDTKLHFISVECTYQVNKVAYKISTGKSSQSYKLAPPDYFALVDDIVVLLWVTNNETIELKGIGADIDYLIKEKKVSLESKVKYFDPPIWTLVKCGGNYELSIGLDEIIEDVPPCDYSSKIDLAADSIALLKKK